jgi:peptide/nickel transport system substrate-binding protein
MAIRPRCLWGAFLTITFLVLITACGEDPAGVSTTAAPAATPNATSVATAAPTTQAETEPTPAGSGADADSGSATSEVTPPTATSAPTATPPPALKTLTVCMAAEPADLYLYGVPMLVQQGVLHGLYENLYTSLDYAYQPQGLVKLPSLADGDATLEAVVVEAGDRVLNTRGDVVFLAEGVEVEDAQGNQVVFDGEPLRMNQMTAEFTFQPLVWEDGEPVTAGDSVFSFEIARYPDTRADHRRTERTTAYEALDERTVRWTGVPGWRDREYFLNVWSPLPEHAWGDYAVEDLATTEAVLRRPLANGPFRLAEWIPGEQIRLVKNEHYYRADEGLPAVDEVLFRPLIEPAAILSGLFNGTCDIGYQDGIDLGRLDVLLDAEVEGSLAPAIVSSMVYEHLDFGVQPVAAYAETRPDWFGDVRVRQGVAHCINREALLDLDYLGRGTVWDAYVPADHPLFPADGQTYPYDPQQGNALLDAAGFSDADGDGVRENTEGIPLIITLQTTSGAELRPKMADSIIADLADCGIETTVALVAGDAFFASGPAGPLFGRQFDLGLFAWLAHIDPACEIYETKEIPGPSPEFPAGWSGNNVTGWSNPDFDAACETALRSFPGTTEHAAAHQEALRIFMAELPSLPLIPRLKISAARPEVQDFHLDPSQPSELWNLFELDKEMEK